MEENHKGKDCKYADNLTCQEGYCSECIIYDKYLEQLQDYLEAQDEVEYD